MLSPPPLPLTLKSKVYVPPRKRNDDSLTRGHQFVYFLLLYDLIMSHWLGVTDLFEGHKYPPSQQYKVFNSNPTIPTLFGFVKTHKSGNLMRSVISLKGGPFHRIGEWILGELKKIIPKGKYTLNNLEEMEKCLFSKNNNKEILIASLDVKSMYPSMPINSVSEILRYRMKQSNISDLTESFLNIVKYFLENVQVKFSGKELKQKDGLSIGARTSPLLAYLVMDWLEEQIIKKKLTEVKLYKRYVDDIIIILPKQNKRIIEEIQRKFNE